MGELKKDSWDQEWILWFADNLKDFLPSDHPHWEVSSGPETTLPDFKLTVENDLCSTNSIRCYRCGNLDHKANICTMKRDNKLRPKRKNRAKRFNPA
jgi:predicted deacetylase